MPGTYSQILLHIVFSTRRREPWITAHVAKDLYAHIGGIVRAEKGTLYDIGGIEDHVHMYLRWRTDAAVSDLMRTVKARSSKFVHEKFGGLSSFAWQRVLRQQIARRCRQAIHRRAGGASPERGFQIRIAAPSARARGRVR